METRNYPRHQQFTLNNFIIERASKQAEAPRASFRFPLHAASVAGRATLCGSKQNVQATNYGTLPTIKPGRVSREGRQYCLFTTTFFFFLYLRSNQIAGLLPTVFKNKQVKTSR